MPDRVSESRKPSAKRKEGATIGPSAVNMHPARGAGRFLHGERLYGSSFHGWYYKQLEPVPDNKTVRRGTFYDK